MLGKAILEKSHKRLETAPCNYHKTSFQSRAQVSTKQSKTENISDLNKNRKSTSIQKCTLRNNFNSSIFHFRYLRDAYIFSGRYNAHRNNKDMIALLFLVGIVLAVVSFRAHVSCVAAFCK